MPPETATGARGHQKLATPCQYFSFIARTAGSAFCRAVRLSKMSLRQTAVLTNGGWSGSKYPAWFPRSPALYTLTKTADSSTQALDPGRDGRARCQPPLTSVQTNAPCPLLVGSKLAGRNAFNPLSTPAADASQSAFHCYVQRMLKPI